MTMRKMIAAVVAVAMVGTSITPAFAGNRGFGYNGSKFRSGKFYGDRYYGRRYDKRDRFDAGDAIGIIAVVGIIAAIASASSSKKRARDAGIDDRTYDRGPYQKGAINSENDAVDACAQAAEDRAGKSSSVRDVTKVSATQDGWEINGIIEVRDDWRDKSVQPREFRCVVRDGTLSAVFVDNSTVAAR
jgi:hypothetical protein